MFVPTLSLGTVERSNSADNCIEKPRSGFFKRAKAPLKALLGCALTVGLFGSGQAQAQSATVVIQASNSPVPEGSGGGRINADFRVSLSRPASSNSSIQVRPISGTATASTVSTPTSPADFDDNGPITVNFPTGSMGPITVSVPIVGDDADEPDENFTLQTVPGSATGGISNTTTVIAQTTIQDDDSSPVITVDDATVTEGTGTNSTLNFAVNLSAASGRDIRIGFATGTDPNSPTNSATSPSDFQARSSTLLIPAGQTTGNIAITVIGDSVDEGTETLALNLSNPNPDIADLGTTQAIGTILDDDGPRVTISDVTLNEGSDFDFTVTLSSPSPETITVNFNTVDNNANAKQDYVANSGTLTFFPGTTNQTVTVRTIDDSLSEPQENFRVLLSGASGGVTIDDSEGLGTIIDNDGVPRISIQPNSITEGNSGQQFLNFTATLDNASSQQVSFQFRTANGNSGPDVDSAQAGSDYTSTNGGIIFSAGTTTKVISVPVLGDTIDERNEVFNVIASNAIGAVFASNTVTTTTVGTIIDDDGPVISFTAPRSIIEGPRGARSSAVFTVRLSKSSPDDVTFVFTTRQGTATERLDYTFKRVAVTIPAGTTSFDIPVQILGDDINEPDETFTADLTNVQGATVATGQGSVTAIITDDDAMPVLNITPAAISQKEGSGGRTGAYNFVVKLSGATASTVTVAYNTRDITAKATLDYSPPTKNSTLTFNPGILSQTISIPIIGDDIYENNESFAVDLSNAVNATLSSPSSATAQLLNDDSKPLISVNNQFNLPEAATAGTSVATFRVSLSRPSGLPTTFNFTTVQPTANSGVYRPATSGVDYGGVSGQLTIPAGQTGIDIPVNILGDILDEYTEYFLLRLSNPDNASIGTNDGRGTIIDDDAEPTVSIDPPTADNLAIEGDAGRTDLFAVFPVTLSAVAGRDVVIRYQLSPQGNTNPASVYPSANVDVAPVNPTDSTVVKNSSTGTLTIPAGSKTGEIRVAGIADRIDENLLEDYRVTGTIITPNGSEGANAITFAAGKDFATSTVEDRDAGFSDFSTTVGNKDEGNESFSTSGNTNATVVTITGNQFRTEGIAAVFFGVNDGKADTEASTSNINALSETQFTVRVPNGAVTGKLRIITNTGRQLAPSDPNDTGRDRDFIVNAVVTGFDPDRGVERNTQVVISARNLDDPNNRFTGVRFNGVASTQRSAGVDPVVFTDSNGQKFVRATVPAGATTGPITITTQRGTLAGYPPSQDNFTVDTAAPGTVGFPDNLQTVDVLENENGLSTSPPTPIGRYELQLKPAKNQGNNTEVPPRGDVTVRVTVVDDVPTGSSVRSPVISVSAGRVTTSIGRFFDVVFPAGSLQSQTINLVDAGNDIIKPAFTNVLFQAQTPRVITISAYIRLTNDPQLYPSGTAANADKITIDRLDIHGLDTDIGTNLRTSEDQDSVQNKTHFKLNLANVNNGVIVGTDGVGVATKRFSAKPQATLLNPDGTVNRDAEPKSDVFLPFKVSRPEEALIRYFVMVPDPNRAGAFIQRFPGGAVFRPTATLIYATDPTRDEYYKYDHYIEAKGVDDTLQDGDQAYQIILDLGSATNPNSNGSDPEFSQLNLVTPFTLNNNDNEQSVGNGEPGFIFTPAATGTPAATRLSTNESGGQDFFTAVLRTRPTTGKVTLRLQTGNPGEVGLVNPKNPSEVRSLQDYIFYADPKASYQPNESLWNTPQTILVAGIDDTKLDGPQTTSILTSTYDSGTSDPAYKTIDPADIIVVNEDNESIGITVQPSTLVIAEGATDTFSLRLSTQPTGDVVIRFSNSDPTIARYVLPNGTNTLTFTRINYATPQTVTVRAIDDGAFVAERVAAIRTDASSSDPKFNGIPVTDVTVRVQNSTSAFVVTPAEVLTAGLTTSEDGRSDAFQVRLTRAPLSDVTLAISSSNASEVVLTAAGQARATTINLTFTPSNFATAQTVNVVGVDDTLRDGNKTVSLNGLVTTSDVNYAQQTFDSLNVVNLDNDTASGGAAVTFAPNGTYTVSFPFAVGSAANATLTVSQALSLASGTGDPAFTLYKFNVTGQRNSRALTGTDFIPLGANDVLTRGIGYRLVTGSKTIRLNTRAQVHTLSVYPAKYTEFPISLNWNPNYLAQTSAPNNASNGYNFIGFPFDPNNFNRVSFSSSKVEFGNTATGIETYNNIADAAAAGVIDQNLYTVEADGTLVKVSSTDLQLRPYRAYFVRILRKTKKNLKSGVETDVPLILTLRNPTT